MIGRVENQNIIEEINKIGKDILLPKKDIDIIIELSKSGDSYRYAREIAEELDYSKYLIASRCKVLESEHDGLIDRIKLKGNDSYKYRITDKARKIYIESIIS